MSEELISVSTILLFGRVVEDVQLGRNEKAGKGAKSATRRGVNKLLQKEVEGGEPKLARIYAFAFEGHYYDLSKPALFLVHGAGDEGSQAAGYTGVADKTRQLASDIRVWAQDKSDLSIRLDVETGTLERILLEGELSADRLRTHYSGEKVRLRGDRGPGSDNL